MPSDKGKTSSKSPASQAAKAAARQSRSPSETKHTGSKAASQVAKAEAKRSRASATAASQAAKKAVQQSKERATPSGKKVGKGDKQKTQHRVQMSRENKQNQKRKAERFAERKGKEALHGKGYKWVGSLTYGKNKTGIDAFGAKRRRDGKIEIAHLEAKGSYSRKGAVSAGETKGRLTPDTRGIQEGTSAFFWNRVSMISEKGSAKQRQSANILLQAKRDGKIAQTRNYAFRANIATGQTGLFRLFPDKSDTKKVGRVSQVKSPV